MNLQTAVAPELWEAVRRSYEAQLWSNAVLDSIQYLGDTLRTKTGLHSDGAALVGQALGGKSPKLKLNRLETESEQSIQAGTEHILRGLYQAIRNPRSHGRLDDTHADADAVIMFVDYLLRVLGHAKTAFSIEDCVGRIIDAHFVPNERYASLILADIPVRQRLQVAIAVYRRKTETDGTRLRYFFSTCIAALAREDARDLFNVISKDLRDSTEEAALRSTLQVLDPAHWLSLDEAARLRTENRIILNIKDGRYSRSTDKCLAGALATWSWDFWPHFSLKKELIVTMVAKLRSAARDSEDYVLRYCFPQLYRLAPSPPASLQRQVALRLKAGDVRYKEAVTAIDAWPEEAWSDDVRSALAAFQAVELVTQEEEEDEDLPF